MSEAELPQLLANAFEVIAGAAGSEAGGAIWRLEMSRRDLDANLVRLPPGDLIMEHEGAEVDVLAVVLDGSARVGTESGGLDVRAGSVVWLPKRSRRSVTAGPEGVSYLSIHQRREALVIGSPTPRPEDGN
jgi:quercetin dioxygenase-like cupin family protein